MPDTASQPAAARPAIVLVAFGSSVDAAREVYTHILRQARARFPGHDVSCAFTAQSIIDALRAQRRDNGELTLAEAVREARGKGHTRIVLQSLHVVPGQKDAEIRKLTIPGAEVACGAPLLQTDADMHSVLAALTGEITPEIPTVFCGHGNDHHPEYTTELVKFEALLRARHANAFLCTVEGQPGTAALTGEIRAAVARAGGQIRFVPLMLVAGDHMLNDVAGDEADAWRNLAGATSVTLAAPLGYNPAVLEIFWRHLDAALTILACPAAATPE